MKRSPGCSYARSIISTTTCCVRCRMRAPHHPFQKSIALHRDESASAIDGGSPARHLHRQQYRYSCLRGLSLKRHQQLPAEPAITPSCQQLHIHKRPFSRAVHNIHPSNCHAFHANQRRNHRRLILSVVRGAEVVLHIAEGCHLHARPAQRYQFWVPNLTVKLAQKMLISGCNRVKR